MILAFVEIPVIFIAIAGAVALVLPFFFGTWCFRRGLNLSRNQAALVVPLCLALSAASVFYRSSFTVRSQYERVPVWILVCAGALPFVAVPFIISLYQRWLGNKLTDAEKAPGMEGVRAWLGGGHLALAFFVSGFASAAYNYSFWGLLSLTIMALLAYPVLNMASTSFQPVPPKTEDLSPERERVLRMLDEGKINAEESAELLNALGHSAQPPRLPTATAADPHRKIVLTGLVLLLIGFFLPWFSYNLGDEMNRVFSGMQEQMSHLAQQNPGTVFQMPNTGSVHVSGGDIGYGLGWFVLLLGIAAAALPYLASHLPPDSQHKARLITLGIGSLILVYLLTQNLRFVSIGIVLGLAGYALQWIGTLKERQGVAK